MNPTIVYLDPPADVETRIIQALTALMPARSTTIEKVASQVADSPAYVTRYHIGGRGYSSYLNVPDRGVSLPLHSDVRGLQLRGDDHG